MADLTKNINVGVDASGVKTGLQEATKSIKDFGKTVQDESNKGAGGVDRLGESVKKLGPATDSSMKASERAFKGWSSEITRAATQIQAAGDKVKEFELKAQLKGFTPDMYKPQIDALRGVIAEQDRLRASNTSVGMSAAQMANNLRMVPAQFTDIVVSLQAGQAPLTVLLQQGGQLKDMFGGAGAAAKALGGYILSLINPFTVVASAAAVLAAAYAMGSKENDAFVRAITLSGNATGTTTTQLRQYAREISNVVGTQAQAAEGLAAFVAAGVEGNDQLRKFTQTAIEWEKATGAAVADTAKQFADLQKDPVAAVVKLNEEMNFLTASVYRQIKALDDQGRSADASEVAMNALDAAMRERSKTIKDNLGSIERGWNAIKGAAKTAWDAMLNIGRQETVGDKLAAAQAELNKRMNQPLAVDNEAMRGSREKAIAQLNKEIAALTAQTAAETANAEAKAATAKATEAATSFSKLYDQYKSKDLQRTQELLKAENDHKALLQDTSLTMKERNRIDQEYAEIQKGINDKYADKKKSGRNKELDAENREMERQKKLIGELAGLSSTFYKDWDDLSKAYQKGRISLDALTDSQAKLLAKQPFMVQQAKAEAAAAAENVKVYKEQVAAQDQVAMAYVRLYEGMTKARLAIDALQTSTSNDTERLRLEASLIGGTNTQRRITLQIYDLQIARKKELQRLDETDFATAEDRAEAEQKINDIYEQRGENIKKSVNIEEWSATVQQVEDIFVNGFADMMNNGKSGWDSFCKSLKTSFFSLVAKELYAMFAKPFVVQLVGSFMGMLGGGGGLLGGLLGGGSSGGGGGVMGLLSNGSSAYSLYSGQGLLGQGSRYVANMLGWGGGGGGASTTGTVISGIAPSEVGTSSFMGLNGGYAAAGVMMIPLIAAYLGGMFKEEKQVGSGITGELGGNLYGYQLMRESGGLFDGPNYRYVVAEKEIEKSKAEIERLKKEIADNPDDKRNAYREMQIQRQYSRLEMLSQYNGSIEASKGPIKILQDAFTAMREDTAARADSLKLDGDSIRAMKVTLGLDEIHPDTGGKGLELTGLSQEEASAKIQAALAQANEEMARSVLGTWQEQTREVTRMVWDNVELPSDGDTQQYGRVGREVTDTVTEQVFVMSEYVRAGETAVQALTRLSDSLLSVNTVFDMLGVTLMDTSLAGADLASDIIDAFGGGDKFSAATSNYYDKFYSDQEKVQTQTRLLNEQLKKLGVETMPTSREALREYINGIDLSTEQGRKLYASLLGLVDVFDMIYTSAENIAGLKQDLNVQLLRAQGNDAEALRLEREKQIKELEKYKDPELVRMQREVWAAEDKTKADEEAKQAAETAKSLGMKNLEAAVAREKEYWNKFSADAKESLSKASSYFDLVTNAAKSLRESVEDGSSWAAAAGMVFIEQALANARNGGGLSDLDATKSAISAATGGLVMDNYATQAELDYDKKVLAGQLDELGGYAELAKTDAQKQIDLANSQIKRLDDTLTFWKEYGEEQVDATLSVTDAVNALYKLLDPKEQERIRKEEAEKAGLGGGGATPGYTPSGGGSLGGQVTGSNRVTVVGLTADGRAIFSNGEIGQTPAGQTSYNSTGQMNSNGYSLAEFERFKTSGEFEWDAAKNQWRKRASFAIGTNYVPRDMTANIHQGERIIPAADNRALMAALGTQGGGNAELVQEVKALRAELQAINHNTASSAQSGHSLDAAFNQASENGNALRVVVMK